MFYDVFESRLLNQAILNPIFDGSRDVGGTDADFILDSCLIEVKSTINLRVTKTWLHQILGYVLLDHSDQYRLHDVGLYLSRQGKFIEWSLYDLIERLMGQKTPLSRKNAPGLQRTGDSIAGTPLNCYRRNHIDVRPRTANCCPDRNRGSWVPGNQWTP